MKIFSTKTFELHHDHFIYGLYPKAPELGPSMYWFYWWNWLEKDVRFFGYSQDWYDGPFSHFGFWFFNMSWCLPFTDHNGGIN